MKKIVAIPSENLNIPAIIIDAKDNNWLHVFLVTNPISTIVSRMVIDKYGIEESDITMVSIRNTDTSIIDLSPITPIKFWYDRFFEKILGISPKGYRILNVITKKKKNFILYAAWADLEVKKIISSKYCKGHIYLEEGQMAYWPIELYLFKSSNFINRLVNGDHVRSCSDRKDLYRDDAHAFIGILPDVFPSAPEEKRFILTNYEGLKKYYNPVLAGIKTIGLTCAEHRLQPDQWEAMLKTLVDRMPEGGVIKLHPSFSIDITKRNLIKSMLKKIASGSIELCNDDIIIEIEMLYEPKILIGPLTSLSKYAEAFGSKFNHVDLY
jgi:hypothetical protein